MDMLPTIWFFAIGVLWIGYLILEGFDLGVGMHLLFTAKGDTQRRVMLNTIGPVWDGNEVWLLTAGAATFAAFPFWYASLFSTLYLPLTLALLGLIFRAVAIEYRGKGSSERWTRNWDRAIGWGSVRHRLLRRRAAGAHDHRAADRRERRPRRRPVRLGQRLRDPRGSRRRRLLLHPRCRVPRAQDRRPHPGARRAGSSPRWAPIALLPLIAWVLIVQFRGGKLITLIPLALAVVALVWGWLNARRGKEKRAFAGIAIFLGLGSPDAVRGGLPGRAAVDDLPRLRPHRHQRVERLLHAGRHVVGDPVRAADRARLPGVVVLGVPQAHQRGAHPGRQASSSQQSRNETQTATGAPAGGSGRGRAEVDLRLHPPRRRAGSRARHHGRSGRDRDRIGRGTHGCLAAGDRLGIGRVRCSARRIAWGTRTFATRSALASKEALRRDLAARLLDDGHPASAPPPFSAPTGSTSSTTTTRPCFRRSPARPSSRSSSGRDCCSPTGSAPSSSPSPSPWSRCSWPSSGCTPARRCRRRRAALSRLSDHLVELARGLPVLVGLGRAEEQTAALKEISEDYRAKTMKTLRVAFMSSLALELISTISVALVAVTIGLRLVYGDLSLDVALLVLILAPECFTPFRDLGASFHAAQDGLGALKQARAIIDASRHRRRSALARARGRSTISPCGSPTEPRTPCTA